MSCTLATEYGLSKDLLKPQLGDGEETFRNKWARQFSFYASRGEATPVTGPDERQASSTTASTATSAATATSTAKSPTPSQKNIMPPPDNNVTVKKPLAADAPSPRAKEVASPNRVVIKEEKALQSSPAEPAQGHLNHQLQLQLIQEITDLIAKSARLSEIFVKVLDGLHRGAGFERALLCLVTPDRRKYVGRLAAGAHLEALKQYFSFPINPSSDLFSKTLMEDGELMVADAADSAWRNLLPADFAEVTKASSFVIASLRFQEKAVGLFYADCAVSGRPIAEADQRNLLQFVTQARLAIRLCT